jgi:hypothetical protein
MFDEIRPVNVIMVQKIRVFKNSLSRRYSRFVRKRKSSPVSALLRWLHVKKGVFKSCIFEGKIITLKNVIKIQISV